MGVEALPVLQGSETRYVPCLLGARVLHREANVYGRLSANLKWERGRLWFEVDTEIGPRWWLSDNVARLGPIPIPAPRGGR